MCTLLSEVIHRIPLTASGRARVNEEARFADLGHGPHSQSILYPDSTNLNLMTAPEIAGGMTNKRIRPDSKP